MLMKDINVILSRKQGEDYWLVVKSGKIKFCQWFITIYMITLSNLDFAKLQPVREITVGDMAAITICHGSPNKVNEKMLPDDDRTIEVINM
jgi:hypothetical protein